MRYSSLSQFSIPAKFVDIRLITDGRFTYHRCYTISFCPQVIHRTAVEIIAAVIRLFVFFALICVCHHDVCRQNKRSYSNKGE